MRSHILSLTCFSFLGVAALACSSSSSSTPATTGSATASTGTSTGGSAGTSTGGSAGTSTGGSAGTSTGGSAGTSTGGSAGTSTGGSNPGGPTWTAVALLDDTANSAPQAGDATVTGIHFDDMTHGVVTTLAGEGGKGGVIENFTGPTTIAKVALAGTGLCGGGQDCNFLQVTSTPLGLLAYIDFPGADTMYLSSDKGATWAGTKTSLTGTPNSDQVFIGPDSTGAWHELDSIGNLWTTPAAPSATAKWTRTWNASNNTYGGQDPNDTPLPDSECQKEFVTDYFAFDQQQAFWMSADGKTMIYPYNEDVGMCRSTDGGENFNPVLFPTPPAAAMRGPNATLFTSATHGIGAYGNDLEDGGQYVYVTDDAGVTWTAGKLPASVTGAGAAAAIVGAFASPSGNSIYLVGFYQGSPQLPMLLKSTDGGKNFTDVSAALDQVVIKNNLDISKLHSGFALDDKNVWVGGDFGGLFYSPTGAE